MANEIYTPVPRKIGDLLTQVHSGQLGLPDLQRPFVWQNAKVRDLFDSLLNGLPIGYIMLWDAPDSYDEKTKEIGETNKQFPKPKDILIDGQQRLTALYSSVYGVEVLDKNYKKRKIKISYNPIDRVFENWNKSTDNNKYFIPDISEIFIAKQNSEEIKYRKQYIEKLNNYRKSHEEPVLNDELEEKIENGIKELTNILNNTIPSLEINQRADEEIVAEIFVRINSKGQNLNESDFISTLLSVYNQDLRKKIEQFCEDSHIPKSHTAYNDLIEVEAPLILRATAVVAFRRARLKYVYQIMRGKDLETEEITTERREENIKKFDNSIETVLDLNNWHEFLNIVKSAGYINKNIISSKITVIYSYALYLIAKVDYKLSKDELHKLIKKWFFMVSLTNYYNEGTTESLVEQLLNNIKLRKTKESFIEYIGALINNRLTEDYFTYTLSGEFDNQRTQGPAWFAFVASQILLDKNVLFSTNKITGILSPHASGKKTAYEYHHLFPKNYLLKCGRTKEEANKRANFVVLDYETNIAISDKEPATYLNEYKTKLGDLEFFNALKNNAIPENVIDMEYSDFLERRKQLISELIKQAWKKIK
jgi:hypothetical protein